MFGLIVDFQGPEVHGSTLSIFENPKFASAKQIVMKNMIFIANQSFYYQRKDKKNMWKVQKKTEIKSLV